MRRGLILVFAFLSLLCSATAYKFAAPKISVSAVEAKDKVGPRSRPYQEVNLGLIRRIQCNNSDGKTSSVGTAWFIAENTLATAAHVVGDATLCIDVDSRLLILVTHRDWDNDFALAHMEVGPLLAYISYSCEGFKTGKLYFATGWDGGDQFKQTHVIAQRSKSSADSYIKGLRIEGLRFLKGNLYRGMSGGPVIDDHGYAVGINSATDGVGYALSRSLGDTIICGTPRKNKPLT